MSSKRKFSVAEDGESCADNDSTDIFDSDNDSNSDILSPVRKRSKQLAIEDGDIDDEEHIDRQLSEQWVWKEENNKATIWNYTESPGVKVATLCQLGRKKRELDVFNVIFDNAFWENIVTETNRHAEQITNSKNKRRKIDDTWFPVDRDEIKVYFALCIIIAQVKKPTVQMNWSRRAVIETPIFRKTMPLKRFLQITRCLHFATNDTPEHDTDKPRAMKPVTNFFNQKFKEVYTMEEAVAIDESLMKFKGRVSKQLNPSRSRVGVKFCKLCESESGYCYDFKIYTGSDRRNPNDSASPESVVMELSQPVLHRGHTIYLGDLYSSPELFAALVNSETNAVGTVRPDSANMPRDFVKAKLKKGECRTRSCNGILALKWKDKRDVHVISTKHEAAEMTEQGKSQSFNVTWKPKCVVEYNEGMIGIERHDRMLACFPVMRKYTKGHRKVFFYVFDMALFNSYILFKKINAGRKQSYAEYRIEIAESLLKNIPLPEYRGRGRLSNGDLPLRLHAQHWGHFPKHIGPTPSKQRPSRACKVCTKHKKRSETTWECKKCQVALHVPECFERYHTIEDY